MKRIAIRALFITVAVIGFTASQGRRSQVDVNVSIGGFYDELAPYGQWVDCSYGQCWVPARVAADWQPYSNGQWIYTQYGWTWVSNDPWGGNPYHYGTWTSIAGYGWSWVPGTVWAPAWVTWSYSNNYVGWAPLPPTVVFGASGYSGSPIVVRETQYVFVPTNRFVGGNVMSVRVPAQQSAAIFKQTRPVTGFAVSGGIVRNTALPMATIERASGRTIETKSIQTARTAPHAVAAGPSQWSVVAPAREVKAAVAARPQAASRAQRAGRSRNRERECSEGAEGARRVAARSASSAGRGARGASPGVAAAGCAGSARRVLHQADEEAQASAGRREAGHAGAPFSGRAAGRAPRVSGATGRAESASDRREVQAALRRREAGRGVRPRSGRSARRASAAAPPGRAGPEAQGEPSEGEAGREGSETRRREALT